MAEKNNRINTVESFNNTVDVINAWQETFSSTNAEVRAKRERAAALEELNYTPPPDDFTPVKGSPDDLEAIYEKTKAKITPDESALLREDIEPDVHFSRIAPNESPLAKRNAIQAALYHSRLVETAIAFAAADPKSEEAKEFYAKHPEFNVFVDPETNKHKDAFEYLAGKAIADKTFNGDTSYAGWSIINGEQDQEKRAALEEKWRDCKTDYDANVFIGSFLRNRISEQKKLNEERTALYEKNKAIFDTINDTLSEGKPLSLEQMSVLEQIGTTNIKDIKRISEANAIINKYDDLKGISLNDANAINSILGGNDKLKQAFLTGVASKIYNKNKNYLAKEDRFGWASTVKTAEAAWDAAVEYIGGELATKLNIVAPQIGDATIPVNIEQIPEDKKAFELVKAIKSYAESGENKAWQDFSMYGVAAPAIAEMATDMAAYIRRGRLNYAASSFGRNLSQLQEESPFSSQSDLASAAFARTAGTLAAFEFTPILMGKAGIMAPASIQPATEKIYSNIIGAFAGDVAMSTATLNVVMPATQSTIQGVVENALVKDESLRTSVQDFYNATSFENLTSNQNILMNLIFGGLRTKISNRVYNSMRFTREEMKLAGATDEMVNDAARQAKAQAGEDKTKIPQIQRDILIENIRKNAEENPEEHVKNVAEAYRNTSQGKKALFDRENAATQRIMQQGGYSFSEAPDKAGYVRVRTGGKFDAESNFVEGEKFFDLPEDMVNDFVASEMLRNQEGFKAISDPTAKGAAINYIKKAFKNIDIQFMSSSVKLEELKAAAARIRNEVEAHVKDLKEEERASAREKFLNEKDSFHDGQFDKRTVLSMEENMLSEKDATVRQKKLDNALGIESHAFVIRSNDKTSGQKKLTLMLSEDATFAEIMEEAIEQKMMDMIDGVEMPDGSRVKAFELSDVYDSLQSLVNFLKGEGFADAESVLKLPEDVATRIAEGSETASDVAMMRHAVREGLSYLGKADIFERLLNGEVKAEQGVADFFRQYVRANEEIMEMIPVAEAIRSAREAGKLTDILDNLLGEGASDILKSIEAEKEITAKRLVEEKRKAEAEAAKRLSKAEANAAKPSTPANNVERATEASVAEKEQSTIVVEAERENDKVQEISAEDSVTGEKIVLNAEKQIKDEVSSDGQTYIPDLGKERIADKRFNGGYCTQREDGGFEGVVNANLGKKVNRDAVSARAKADSRYADAPVILLRNKKGSYTVISGEAKILANEGKGVKAIVYDKDSFDAVTGEVRNAEWAKMKGLEVAMQNGYATPKEVATYFRSESRKTEPELIADGVSMAKLNGEPMQDYLTGRNIAQGLTESSFKEYNAGRITDADANFVADLTSDIPSKARSEKMQAAAIRQIAEARSQGKPVDYNKIQDSFVQKNVGESYTYPTANFSLRARRKNEAASARENMFKRLRFINDYFKSVDLRRDNVTNAMASNMGDTLGFAKEFYRAFDADGRKSIEQPLLNGLVYAHMLKERVKNPDEKFTAADFKNFISESYMDMGYSLDEATRLTADANADAWVNKGLRVRDMANVYAQLSNALNNSIENQFKSASLKQWKDTVKFFAPPAKSDVSSLQPSQYSSNTLALYKEIVRMSKLTGERYDKEADSLLKIINDKNATNEERDNALGKMYQLQTFGNIDGMSGEQVTNATNMLNRIMSTGVTSWSEVIRKRRELVDSYINDSKAAGSLTTESSYKLQRKQELNERRLWLPRTLSSIRKVFEGAMSLGQQFSSFESTRGFERFGKDFALKTAKANLGYAAREERYLHDFDTFLTMSNADPKDPMQLRGLGLAGHTEKNNFVAKVKKVEKHSGVFCYDVKGNPTRELIINRGTALQMWLSLEQPDVAARMERNHGYTAKTKEQLEAFMRRGMSENDPDALIRLGRWMRQRIQNDGMREVYESRTGLLLPQSENYFPTVYNKGEAELERDVFGVDFTRSEANFLKQRVYHKLDFDMNADALTVFFSSLAERSSYMTHGEMIDQMAYLLNSDFAKRLKLTVGEARYSLLTDTLSSFANLGGKSTSFNVGLTTLINMAQSARASALLAMNVPTEIKQLTAIGHGTSISGVRPHELIYEVLKIRKGKWSDLKEMYSSEAFMSRYGRSNIHNVRAAWRDLVHAPADSNWSDMQVVSRLGMYAIEKLDILANTVSAQAVYNIKTKQLRRQNPDMTEKEIHDAGMGFVELMLDQSAQPQVRFQKSAFVVNHTTSPLIASTAFMGGETLNKLGKFISLLHSNKPEAFKYFLTMNALETAAIVASTWAMTGVLKQDDESWAAWAGVNAAMALSGIQMIGSAPIIGFAYNSLMQTLADTLGIKALQIHARESTVGTALGVNTKDIKKAVMAFSGNKESAMAGVDFSLAVANAARVLPVFGGFFGGARSANQIAASLTSGAQSLAALGNAARWPLTMKKTEQEKKEKDIRLSEDIQITMSDLKKYNTKPKTEKNNRKIEELNAKLAWLTALDPDDKNEFKKTYDEVKGRNKKIAEKARKKKEASGLKKKTIRQQVKEAREVRKESRKLYMPWAWGGEEDEEDVDID